MMAVRTGDLRERVAFDAKVGIDDGHHNTIYEFDAPENAYECWAHFRTLRAGEAVQGARMAGQQTMIVTIRVSDDAHRIDSDWRMRDTATGKVFAVVAPSVMTDNRDMLEIMVQSGVAA